MSITFPGQGGAGPFIQKNCLIGRLWILSACLGSGAPRLPATSLGWGMGGTGGRCRGRSQILGMESGAAASPWLNPIWIFFPAHLWAHPRGKLAQEEEGLVGKPQGLGTNQAPSCPAGKNKRERGCSALTHRSTGPLEELGCLPALGLSEINWQLPEVYKNEPFLGRKP